MSLTNKTSGDAPRPRRKIYAQEACYMALGAAAMVATTPLAAQPRGDEPVAVPRSIKQGIDFTYVDPQMSTVARRASDRRTGFSESSIFPVARGRRPTCSSPSSTRGMQQYQMTYGRMPQVKVPAGPVLKSGSTGKRVDLLRQRLGLSPGGGYDTSLFQAVATYQTVHGLGRAGRRRRQGDDRVTEPRLATLSALARDQRRTGMATSRKPEPSIATWSSIQEPPKPICSTATELRTG